MVCYIGVTGEYNALYTSTNQGFFIAQIRFGVDHGYQYDKMTIWDSWKKAMAEVCHIVIFVMVENPASFNSLKRDKKHNN